MAVFTVLAPADGKPDRTTFVRDGFSWGALIFTVLWALFYRMWVVAALLFAAFAVIAAAESLGLIGAGVAGAINFGITLVFAFEARRLRVKSLERSGFKTSGLIEASNLEAAELAYFANHTSVAPASAQPMRFPAAAPDTLGIFGNV